MNVKEKNPNALDLSLFDLDPKRHEGESYADYVARRSIGQVALKKYLRGARTPRCCG